MKQNLSKLFAKTAFKFSIIVLTIFLWVVANPVRETKQSA